MCGQFILIVYNKEINITISLQIQNTYFLIYLTETAKFYSDVNFVLQSFFGKVHKITRFKSIKNINTYIPYTLFDL